MDDTPNVPGALSLIAEQLPKWWADEGTKDLRDGLSNFVPTDAVDAGLMLVGGPGGKMARKAGAALIAGGASTDAEAGIFKKLPGELRGLVRLLAANAKKADPAEAAIEFANNGLGGKLARGGHGVVDSSKLVFNPNGAALHTHGYAEQALPSFKDFEAWAAQPAQKYLGVVKPSRQGKPGAVIIAPKGSALPAQGELAQFQKSLFKSNPNLVNRLDFGESDASKWKWLLDKANADELDLFLHNTTAPAELMYPGYKTPKATLDELLQASLEQKGSRGEDALLSYLSDGYEDINAALRNGEGADEVARNMDKLFSANEGVRPLENDLAVWRYSTSFPKHDPAFLSTTLSEEFARKNAGSGQVKKIIVPAGERAFDTRNVAPYAYEQEVLLPRGGNLTPIDENTLMFNRSKQGYAQGGTVNKPQGMEHTTSSSQDASTQPLTGSALKALVRGWIAGTAGLPGDLEGLARKGVNWSFGPGGVNVDEAPALPTSEFYKDWLPGKQQGDEMINDIGSVFGGVGATKPVSLTKGALSRVAAAAPGPMAGSRAAMRGVIKAPGGNWLSGSVEDALNGLKRGDFEAIAQLQRVRPGLSVEEARAFIQAPPPSAENVALNNFVDKQLTRYVQKDMATERDPIRALAERGVLHYAPEMVSIDPPRLATQAAREQAGFPRMGNSTSVLAKQWEALSDKFIDPAKAGELTSGHGQGGPFLSQNPWLTKLAPDTPVYELGATARSQDLGFDHLMDELRNAVNINSGLPAHLRLDPESLARVSVPQAVERVAKINDWRAAQKAAADQARANNAATVLHKEYPEGNYFRAGEGSFFTPDQQAAELFGKNFGGKVGRHRLDPKKTATEADLEKVVREYGVLQEGVPLGQYLEQGDNAVTPYSSFIRGALRKQGFDSVSLNDGMAKQPSLVALDDSIIKPHTDNPKGFKWMELKSGDLPEGWSQRKDALGVDIVYGPDGYSTNAGSIKDPRRAALADALKYEGDTMGHCVGGYCDDVASGKSRIFSLRDAKGQPHTTIEVVPKGAVFSDVAKHIGSERADELLDQGVTLSEMIKGIPDFQYPQAIKQIKGKANKAPNPEYLPFVQDFVKSGKWSDVGDLQNTGLVKHPSGYLTQEELQALGQAPQGYASGGSVPGYADGGSVRNALNAAVGGPVKPKGMDHTRSSGQDATTQPLTGSALKALVRGWIAGTAGLPGDLEGLARTVDKYTTLNPAIRQLKDTTPVLPTADFYKEWLPGKQQGDEVISDISSLFGGVGATKPVALGKGALSRIAAATPAPRAGSMAAQRGVIKAPGGNWLSGSIEDALKGLKTEDRMRQGFNDITLKQAQNWPGLEPEATRSLALNAFIDKQLRNYIRNDMATERDPIRALAESWATAKPQKLAEAQARIDALTAKGQELAAQRGVPQEYLTRHRQDVIAAEKAKELIELRQELHIPHEEVGMNRHKAPDMRKLAGFPREGSGVSEAAKAWEDASDTMLKPPMSADAILKMAQDKGYDRMLNNNSWLEKVPPDTPVHEANQTLSANLGFDHLVDELRNAVNPESGLPKELLFNPAHMGKITVPQAVERVADINAWRAAQKAEADMARANNAATVLHKDYPEKGMKWVELKHNKDVEGSGYVLDEASGEMKDPGYNALKDALKYEGDTMGHCVGGYCDDVASGKSRIFSLRDAKGQPHTTIEVSPSRELDPNHEMIPQVILDEASDANMALEDYLASKHPQFMAAPKIVQIKGKGNKAPNPEYLPYVQDFVKSGKWGDVGDLRNSGLVKHQSGYLTPEELQALGQAPQGFADGGSVRNALNAAVGGSGLAKAVGNTERAVGNIASGNASLGDLKSLRDMASQLGYTVPGLSQALGIAGVAKAGYNMASDPSGMNAAKLAATVNPIAAQALGLYQAATDPTPGTLVDAVSSFNPIARAYNGLANSFNFATIGQVLSNLSKIADPNTPAQLRDMFSNTPLKDGFNREQAEIDAMGPTVQDAINAYNQAQALQTNPSLNPASPDFMGPQADAINAYNQAQALQTNPSLNPASPDFMGPQADGGSEGGSGGYGYGGSEGGSGGYGYGGSEGGSGGYGYGGLGGIGGMG